MGIITENLNILGDLRVFSWYLRCTCLVIKATDNVRTYDIQILLRRSSPFYSRILFCVLRRVTRWRITRANLLLRRPFISTTGTATLPYQKNADVHRQFTGVRRPTWTSVAPRHLTSALTQSAVFRRLRDTIRTHTHTYTRTHTHPDTCFLQELFHISEISWNSRSNANVSKPPPYKRYVRNRNFETSVEHRYGTCCTRSVLVHRAKL